MKTVLSPGKLVGQRFRLVRKVGQGAAGQVWLAEDTHLEDEQVACKFLNEQFANDRRAVADLKREVLLTRKLRHPYILAVYTFWETEADPLRFITMEYVEGQTLAELIARRKEPCPISDVLSWTKGLADALDYAHSRQVLHRDVKPGNIVLSKEQRALLVDFGIARTIRETCHRFVGHTTSGTLMFMSPEQLLGNPLDGRSDLYSLASTVYTLLNGTPPFHQGSIVTQVQLKPAPVVPHLPAAVNDVLLRALAKDPGKRHPSCRVFYEALASAVADSIPAPAPARAPAVSAFDESSTTVHLPALEPERFKVRLGDALVEAGLISPNQVEEALRTQEQTRGKFGAVLVQLGYASEQAIAEALAKQLDMPFVLLEDEAFDADVVALVSKETAAAGRFIPIRRSGDDVIVAMADPLDLVAVADIEETCQARIEFRVATESDILSAIDKQYPDA